MCSSDLGFEVIPTDLPGTDILQEDAFARQLDRTAPDVARPLGSDRWSSDFWARLDVRWHTGPVL